LRIFFLVILFYQIIGYAYADQIINSISTKDNDFVLEFNAKPQYKVFTLDNPNRLVIDLKNCKESKSFKKQFQHHLIKSVRTAIRDQKNLRIVFDLTSPLDSKKYYSLDENNKLIIKLNSKIITKKIETPKPEVKKPVAAKKQEIVKKPAQAKIPEPKKMLNKDIVIVIDPGHGGTDPGAIGSKGTLEKNVTLAYALELKKYLETKFGYQVVLTRYGDYFVSLDDRVEKAKNVKAEIFLSLHADSYTDHKTRGMSIYTISDKASDQEDKNLLNKKTHISNINLHNQDKDVAHMLVDLTRRKNKNNSKELSKNILMEVGNKNIILQKEPLKLAGFKVLKDAEIASIMIELGYLSNQEEEKLLNQVQNKSKTASAIGTAIGNYFSKKN
jgi:N-acetylmuramoyl-L-alanine amidase